MFTVDVLSGHVDLTSHGALIVEETFSTFQVQEAFSLFFPSPRLVELQPLDEFTKTCFVLYSFGGEK